jgi:hypothetical protein
LTFLDIVFSAIGLSAFDSSAESSQLASSELEFSELSSLSSAFWVCSLPLSTTLLFSCSGFGVIEAEWLASINYIMIRQLV